MGVLLSPGQFGVPVWGSHFGGSQFWGPGVIGPIWGSCFGGPALGVPMSPLWFGLPLSLLHVGVPLSPLCYRGSGFGGPSITSGGSQCHHCNLGVPVSPLWGPGVTIWLWGPSVTTVVWGPSVSAALWGPAVTSVALGLLASLSGFGGPSITTRGSKCPRPIVGCPGVTTVIWGSRCHHCGVPLSLPSFGGPSVSAALWGPAVTTVVWGS